MDEIDELINQARILIKEKPPTRELALMITKLDEASLWYGVAKAISQMEKDNDDR